MFKKTRIALTPPLSTLGRWARRHGKKAAGIAALTAAGIAGEESARDYYLEHHTSTDYPPIHIPADAYRSKNTGLSYIVFDPELVESLSAGECAAIYCHEVAHVKHGDVTIPKSSFTRRVRREMEYDADGFAMKYSGQPLEVVKSALEKATRLKNRRNIVWSLKEIAANPLIEMLHENYKWLAHSKHPRLCDRLSHVEKVAAQSHESEPAVSGADLPFLSNYAKRGGRNVFG